MRQVKGMQGELGGLVQGVVVAVSERQPGRIEAARAVADQVDDGTEFIGHGSVVRGGNGTGKYIGRAGMMDAAQVE